MTGFGKADQPAYPYSLEDYKNEVFEYLYKFGLKNVSVVAHSFGARVALKCELHKPTFKKAVLTGAAGLKPRFNAKTFVKKTYYKAVKNFLSEEKRLKFYSDDYKNSSPIMRQSFIKIVNETFDGKLNAINLKTLIVVGSDDKTTPPYLAKRFHRGLKNSSLAIIKNAGHFAFLDRPDVFNEAAFGFLTDNFFEKKIIL